MVFKGKNKFFFTISLSSCLLYSCAEKTKSKKTDEDIRTNLISNFSADSNFNNSQGSSKLTQKDIEERERSCPLQNTNFKNIIKEVSLEYNNKNLLDQSNKAAIPLIKILAKTSSLTATVPEAKNAPHACYYPEIYLANAIAMEALQKIPFAPFNQETLMLVSSNGKDAAEVTEWNQKETLKNSRFAKLNGLIRSATLAQKIANTDKEKSNYIPRIYSEINGKEIYLFDINKSLKQDAYYSQISSLANALAAIGHYERAIYRWNGVFSASELNMQVSLPNESLQDALRMSEFSNENSVNDLVSLKYVIAHDLIMAQKNANEALQYQTCEAKSFFGNNIPAHMLTVCPTLEKIKNRALQIDLKRLVCSTGTKILEEKNTNDVIGNYLWDEAQCDFYITNEPSLEKSYIDYQGISYHSIAPFSLNPIRVEKSIDDFQKRFEFLKTLQANVTLIQTRDYENKRQEILDNSEALKDELEVAKKAQNKASQEIAFASFQRDSAKSLLDAAENEIELYQVEQKNQFRNYITNLSSIRSYQSLKSILLRYETEKRSALDQYTNELCGSGGTSNCKGGNLGKLASLSKERIETVTQDWKNECARLVNQFNTNTRIIGENGCDISNILGSIQFSSNPDIIYSQINEALNSSKNILTNSCKVAVVSEALTSLKNKEFEDALAFSSSGKTCRKESKSVCSNSDRDRGGGGTPRCQPVHYDVCTDNGDEKIKAIKNSIEKMQKDFSKQVDDRASESTPGYFTSTKSNVNYIKSIAEMNTENVFLQQKLNINNLNKYLLKRPNEYCSNLVNDRNSPEIASILDAKILKEQSYLQKLQITYSLNQEEMDLERMVNERKTQIDDQILQTKQLIQNLENTLGIPVEMISDIKKVEYQLSSENGFQQFYESHKEKLNYIPLKNAKNKKAAQENAFLAAKQTILISQENFEIFKKQKENIQLSIERSANRAEAHNHNYFLFTSLTPNVMSFSSDIWKIEYVKNLAKQVVRSISYKILDMDPTIRNDKTSLFASDISTTKKICSYLASFEDAKLCLDSLKILQDKFSFKNLPYLGKLLNTNTLKIYSSDLRTQKDEYPNEGEQVFDDNFLEILNQNGMATFNFDEKFMVDKGFLPEEFRNDYYRAKIVSITVNVIQENPVDKKYMKRPFDGSANIAHLLHDGLYLQDNSKELCNENYKNYSYKQFKDYENELQLDYIKEKYQSVGKNYPYIFSLTPNQEMMCGKVNTLYSPLSYMSNSLIPYTDSEGIEKPITILNDPETTIFNGTKTTSLNWLYNLKKDYNSFPPLNDVFWQPLTGYISDLDSDDTDISELSDRISNCLTSSDIDSSNCAIAKKSVHQSFAGFPLLGKYTFVYAQHNRDKVKNTKKPENKKTKIKGIEIHFNILM